LIYLVTFAITQGKEHRIVGKLMNRKLEKTFKEAVLENKAPRKTINNSG